MAVSNDTSVYVACHRVVCVTKAASNDTSGPRQCPSMCPMMTSSPMGLAVDRSSSMSVHMSNDDIITHGSGNGQILVNVRPCAQ